MNDTSSTRARAVPRPPAISVIIPTFNRPRLLERALKSVLSQRVDALEIIVINDGSSADYEPIYKKYREEVVFIEQTETGGVSAARNAGIQKAHGEWIAFLDDDDEYQERYLEVLSGIVTRVKPDVGIIWSNISRRKYNELGLIVGTDTIDYTGVDRSIDTMKSAVVSIGLGYGVAIRATCFQALGGFDSSFPVAEDTEFILRLLHSGSKPEFSNANGVIVHDHNEKKLTHNFKAHSDLRLHDRLLIRYMPIFKQNYDLYEWFNYFSVKTHYSVGNYMYGYNRAIKMLTGWPTKLRIWVISIGLIFEGGKSQLCLWTQRISESFKYSKKL